MQLPKLTSSTSQLCQYIHSSRSIFVIDSKIGIVNSSTFLHYITTRLHCKYYFCSWDFGWFDNNVQYWNVEFYMGIVNSTTHPQQSIINTIAANKAILELYIAYDESLWTVINFQFAAENVLTVLPILHLGYIKNIRISCRGWYTTLYTQWQVW